MKGTFTQIHRPGEGALHAGAVRSLPSV